MYNKEDISKFHDRMFDLVKQAKFYEYEKAIEDFDWINNAIQIFEKLFKNKNNIFLIGNGASCSMASHFASDFTKNGEIRAFSSNEGALLTCFGNDFSFEDSYKEILKRHMNDYDCLIAISSSGKSKNILNAANFVKENYKNSSIITLSGFLDSNPLRKIGNYNLHLGIEDYGYVESAHSYYLHLILDLWIQYKNKYINNKDK